MYQLPAFRETDLATQHGFIAAHPLGLLICSDMAGCEIAEASAARPKWR